MFSCKFDTYKVIILVGLVCGITGAVSGEAGASPEEEPKVSVFAVMPKKVPKLFEWPSEEIIAGERRIWKCTNRHLLGAKGETVNWIQKIITKEWLPEDPNYLKRQVIMIRDEYGPVDATHIRWETNDYRIEVTQTDTVFAAKLSPLKTGQTTATLADKKARAKGLCSQFFNESGMMTVIEAGRTKRVRGNVMPKLLSASFEKGHIRSFADGIHGLCKGLDVPDPVEISNFDCWWRRVNWWTDGRVVGFYTLKSEGGPWSANYNSALDDTWFEGSPYTRKSEGEIQAQ